MNTEILSFGAIGDGKTLTTKPIQDAIDACAAKGGGRVSVPAGTYKIGTIWLKSQVELHLEHGSVLLGSENLDDYNEDDAFPQNKTSRDNEHWLGKHMIIALECENVAITGTGTINGNGDIFMGEEKPWHAWTWNEGIRQAKDPILCRPGPVICFVECKKVKILDITVTNQPAWGCLVHGCEYVNIRGIRTINDHRFFNSDGIDIDSSRFVTVSDCIIDTGDDAIAIRGNESILKKQPSPCEYITITNCVLGSCSCGIRVGVGSGTVRHVRVSNICITRGAPGIQLMSSYKTYSGTTLEDISFTNISMTKTSRPMEIVEESTEGGSIRDVVIDNLRAEVYGFIHFRVANTDTVKNIRLKNWKIYMIEGLAPFSDKCREFMGDIWFRAKNIRGLEVSDFRVYDEKNLLAAWPKGFISSQNCPNAKWEDIYLNDKKVPIP